MKITWLLTFFCIAGILVRENAAQIPASILECYNSTDILDRENRLPNNIHALIAIIRKIENTPLLDMDLPTLAVAILHSFRVDGIERSTSTTSEDGVIPYSIDGFSQYRNAAMLGLVTGSTRSLPNNTLTLVERCSLHFMLSTSVELAQRGDESTVCSSIGTASKVKRDIKDNREIFTSQKPRNLSRHEILRRATTTAESTCPVENGIVSTSWGAVSAGPVIAGIASALVQQIVPLSELMDENQVASGYANGSPIHNRWLATFAGDLAEAALRQATSTASKIGLAGGFNSTALPRWYFLTSPEDHEMTDAEIRGDLDGLILADGASLWYSRASTLRLSQILDMYYSSHGVLNSTIQACSRFDNFNTVAANATLVDQAISASLLLHKDIASVTIVPVAVRNFATAAAVALNSYIPNGLSNGLSCQNTIIADDVNKPSTHLTIILDTTWPFANVQPLLVTLLEGIQVSMFNSNFTIINGLDGSLVINGSNTLLDIYNFDSTQYANLASGFDLPNALRTLRTLQTERLDNEQSQNIGGTNSDVVVILSYLSTLSDTDRADCEEQLRIMRLQVPDAQFLYLTHGSVNPWSSLAVDSTADVFSTTTITTTDTSTLITPVVSRIKQAPKRLINSACGSSFSASGSASGSFIDYLQPAGINYYRLHPNYFGAERATVTVTPGGWVYLYICISRTVVQPSRNATDDVTCSVIVDGSVSISFFCDNTASINACQPLYLSVERAAAISTDYQCTDATVCRYPDMRRYTISFEKLICRSSASASFIAPFIIILSLVLNLVN